MSNTNHEWIIGQADMGPSALSARWKKKKNIDVTAM